MDGSGSEVFTSRCQAAKKRSTFAWCGQKMGSFGDVQPSQKSPAAPRCPASLAHAAQCWHGASAPSAETYGWPSPPGNRMHSPLASISPQRLSFRAQVQDAASQTRHPLSTSAIAGPSCFASQSAVVPQAPPSQRCAKEWSPRMPSSMQSNMPMYLVRSESIFTLQACGRGKY